MEIRERRNAYAEIRKKNIKDERSDSFKRGEESKKKTIIVMNSWF